MVSQPQILTGQDEAKDDDAQSQFEETLSIRDKIEILRNIDDVRTIKLGLLRSFFAQIINTPSIEDKRDYLKEVFKLRSIKEPDVFRSIFLGVLSEERAKRVDRRYVSHYFDYDAFHLGYVYDRSVGSYTKIEDDIRVLYILSDRVSELLRIIAAGWQPGNTGVYGVFGGQAIDYYRTVFELLLHYDKFKLKDKASFLLGEQGYLVNSVSLGRSVFKDGFDYKKILAKLGGENIYSIENIFYILTLGGFVFKLSRVDNKKEEAKDLFRRLTEIYPFLDHNRKIEAHLGINHEDNA